jgi:nucleotide-binding universal stress UspA family protein
MRIRRILVGMDWSAAALDAWREACLIARTFGAELLLAHALAPSDSDDERRATELLVDTAGQRPAKTLVRVGRPSDVVLALAQEHDVDLIVLGAGERTALDRVLLGTTAERVVREAAAPVWLARPGRAHAEVKRILCGFDGDGTSRESGVALETAVFLCRLFVSDLTVVTIVPDERTPLFGAPDAGRRADALAEGEVRLRAHLSTIDTHGLTTRVIARPGKPALGIVDAAHEVGCDLLVVATHERSALERLWSGSVAERVIRAAPSSILVVRAR